MFLRNTLDSAVIQTWSERTGLYRRRTWWLWVVVLLATLAPIAIMVSLGSSLFWWAFAIFGLGMLIIGTVLSRETHLLFCPNCGKRPTPLQGRYQSPLYADYCVHCGYWLKKPSTPYG